MIKAFEEKVKDGLRKCDVNTENLTSSLKIGIGVSGGADSVSLLVALSHIFKPENLFAVTVNHGIRKAEETEGDAEFVVSLCKTLGIFCKRVDIPSGKILKTASKNGLSTEETARKFRYEIFDSFVNENNLDYLCLAHNKNDQIETVLMRVLNGSGSEGLSGIPLKRGKFIRPLISITRTEIEAYLNCQKIEWRTDCTNLENNYSRNKIRNIISPLLEENFPGWQENIISLSQKAASDNYFIEKQVSEAFEKIVKWDKENAKAVIRKSEFFKLEFAVQRRLIYKALNSAGFGMRFPFKHIVEICSWNNEKNKSLTFENCVIFSDDQSIIIEKKQSSEEITDFELIFTSENDKFKHNELSFEIQKADDRFYLAVTSDKESKVTEVTFPFVVRSVQTGDKIKDSKGKLKKITDIFSDWKVSEKDKKQLFVIQLLNEKMEIHALMGSFAGYKDWLIKPL